MAVGTGKIGAITAELMDRYAQMVQVDGAAI